MSEQLMSSFDWIRLECIPLPASPYQPLTVFWNPESGELVGERADFVLEIIHQATAAGHLKGETRSHFEITDPLSKPSELAAVLAQFFWVIPQPVESPHQMILEQPKNLQ